MSSIRELRHAVRTILRTPGLSLVAVVSLALGIAANTSIFSLVHSFLLRPLPYENPDRLVVVWESERSRSDDRLSAAPANFFDWREQTQSFETLVASNFTTATLTGHERPEQLSMARVSPSFFTTLGTQPLDGRTFRPDEGAAASAPVAVISEKLWRGRLGEKPGIVGSLLTLNGEDHTVVGVMPETFGFLLGTVDLWVASDFEARRRDRDERALVVAGVLRPGVTRAQAQEEMTAIASRLETLHPETNEGVEIELQAVTDVFPGATDTRLVQILMIVVGMVLMVACVNVASLLLAKSGARHKEMAVRTALGAGRGRLLRQLLSESLLLALVAGGLGAVFSIWGVRGIASSMPDLIPGFYMPRLDAPVLTFCLAISLLAGLTFGISPALQALRGSRLAGLLDSTRGSTSTRERKRLLSSFVVAELALALTILIGAATLTDVLHKSLDIAPGYDPEGLLTLRLDFPEHRFANDEDILPHTERLRLALEESSNASDLTLISHLPRTRNLPFSEFTVDGRETPRDKTPRTSWLAASPGYFHAMGINLEEGRAFNLSDEAESAPVVVVNRRLVEQHFADTTSVVGRRLTLDDTSHEIVGVVADVAQERMSGVQPIAPAVYFPLTQRPVRALYVVARSPGDPYQLAEPLRQAIWRTDPEQTISELQSLREYVTTQLAGPNVIARVLFNIGLLALVLAAMGTYGIMSFAVSQQTGEIGVRMALGARPRQILTRVTRQGASLAALGLLLGIPASIGVVRLIEGLFEAAASDGLDVVGGIPMQPLLQVGGLLAIVGFLACYLPARRATRVDPVAALQSD